MQNLSEALVILSKFFLIEAVVVVIFARGAAEK